MTIKSPLINVMERAARMAGRGLIHDFGEIEQLQVSTKGPGDFVSNADLKAEATLKEELHRVRPDFSMLMEEGGATEVANSEHRWIVDPLDGTLNFLHGIPHFSISIGVERTWLSAGREISEIIAGLVYDPIHDTSYWAEKGQGAYLNDRRIRVSGRRTLSSSVIASGLPVLERGDQALFLAENAALMGRVAGLRQFGSAALDLAYVAAGYCDGLWQDALKPWDMAAGILLVREAGGFVTDFKGGGDMFKSGTILAANSLLHEEILTILTDARDQKN
ncbi:MAG: inositol monophosphatase family protein [Alphaproteobacteria bacterium]|jgi:myo-inositol-1(or 4)-monophosphatase